MGRRPPRGPACSASSPPPTSGLPRSIPPCAQSRRSPSTTRCSSATPWSRSLPRRRRSPKTRPRWSRSSTSRCPPRSTRWVRCGRARPPCGPARAAAGEAELGMHGARDGRRADPRGGGTQRGQHAAVPPGRCCARLRRGGGGRRAPLRDAHGPPGLPGAARRGGRRRPAGSAHRLDRDTGPVLHALGGVRGARAPGAPGSHRGDADRRRVRGEVRPARASGRGSGAPSAPAGLGRHDADRGVPVDHAGAALRHRAEARRETRRHAHGSRGPCRVRRRRLRGSARSGSRSS